MILVHNDSMKNPEALRKRRAYVLELMAERRPSASPSSQEWVSPEHWAGRYISLRKEVREIDEQLATLAKK